MPMPSGNSLQYPAQTLIGVPLRWRRTGEEPGLTIEALRKTKRPWVATIGLTVSVRFSPRVALKSKAVVARTARVEGEGLEGPARLAKIPAREADTTTTAMRT